jgi:hypothetical protein
LPATEINPISGYDAGNVFSLITPCHITSKISHGLARELVFELAEYLSRRYPQNFSVERHPVSSEKNDENGWYGEGRIRTITIREPVNVTYDLDKEDPMKVAGLL